MDPVLKQLGGNTDSSLLSTGLEIALTPRHEVVNHHFNHVLLQGKETRIKVSPLREDIPSQGLLGCRP